VRAAVTPHPRIDVLVNNGGIEAIRNVETTRSEVAYLSHFMTLLSGDVISTGTPPGVGFGFDPPRYLKPGDIAELGIAGLGEQRQEAKAWSASS